MRTILLVMLLSLGAGFTHAQNTLKIKTENKQVPLGTVKVKFTNHSSETYSLGKEGVYNFDIGKKEVESILIGDTECKVGETVRTNVRTADGDKQLYIGLEENLREGDDGKDYESLIK